MDHAAPRVPHGHSHGAQSSQPPRASAYAVPSAYGALAAIALLGLYFATVTFVSGSAFAVREFGRYWYFIVPLAVAFGVQVALFTRLRVLAGRSADSGGVVAASGTASTVAMVSCCAHYLVNVAPVLGAIGLVAFAAQFQVELFWAGLAASAAGIAFILHRVLRADREHAHCA